jgi:lysozyme
MGIQKKGETLPQMQQRNGGAAAGVDASLMEFVKELEGFSAKAFPDYQQYSIGYGTRAKSANETITRPEAETRLAAELATHAARVDRAAAAQGLALNANERAALISFDFNTGRGDYLIRTSAGVAEIARRLPTWNKVTVDGRKVVNRGLVNRRAEELRLFLS